MAAATTLPRTRRFRTPTVLQMEAVECGAAALGMILGYYRRIVPLEELRQTCGVSRDGTKASNILKAARGYGLNAKGFSKQARDLPAMPLPLVIFWNFNHFLVVEGFAPGKVFLNDPALGPRVVTSQEFEEAFTGVVLVFEPGPEFKKGGVRRGLLAPLRNRLQGSEAGLVYVLLASLALALTGLILPMFSKIFVDQVLVANLRGWIAPLLLGMALTALLRAGLTWLQLNSLLNLETKLSLTGSYRFIRHVLHLPVEFFSQRYGGEVGARVEINDRIARLLSRDLAANLLNCVMAVSYLALMLYFDIVLTIVGVVVAGLNFLALRYVSRFRTDVNVRLLQERGKLMGTNMAGLQAIETLKATGAESDFFSRWSGQLAKVMQAEQQMSVTTRAVEAVPIFLSALNIATILGLGAYRVMEGQMTLGTLVAFQSLMASFLDPVNQLVHLGGTLQEVEGEMNRLDDVLSYKTDPDLARTIDTSVAGKLSPKLSGALELRSISFGHGPLDPPLIQDFGLVMKPGARVALVGPSGSGKTTLAKIVSGLFRPWTGEVLFDGRPRHQWPCAVIANSVAVVDQDFFLFEGSVREVLTIWDPEVSEEDLVRAAKDALIHEEIAARPGGYDSQVEEGGANFSGGQRQRLEIARALVSNPTLLVLDEATSALDPVTENRIDENLRRRGCTCVIVAHRLSTIRDCDEIIVLDQGKIRQRGTHDTLQKETRGLYRKLIES